MKRRLMAAMLAVIGLVGGVQQAFANCMSSAEDAALAFLSGGASYAACVTAELVNTIRNLINTIGQLLTNVISNATQVANAAVDVVRTAGNDAAQALASAQRDLSNAVTQARQVASQPIRAMPVPAATALAGAAGPAGRARPPAAAPAALPRSGNVPTNSPPAYVQPMTAVNMAADPGQIQSALNQAVQKVAGLQSAISADVANRINSGVQRSLQQAQSHVSTAADIARTLLEQPLIALKDSLLDLLNHPDRLFDPSDVINSQIQIISNNVVNAMNRINDDITHDALNTLGGIESDISHAQGNAQAALAIVDAMNRLSRERTQPALNNLLSLIGTPGSTLGTARMVGPQGGLGTAHAVIGARPAVAFRVDAIRARLVTRKADSIAPIKRVTDDITHQWASIKTARANRPVALNAQVTQQGQAELDRLFKGKSPQEAQQQKAQLLALARQRFANNPQVLTKIEQQLDQQISARVRVAPVPLGVGPAARPARMGDGSVRSGSMAR